MNVQQDPAGPACRNRFALSCCRVPLSCAAIIAFLGVVMFLASSPPASAKAEQVKDAGKCPPVTRKDSAVDVLHGVSILDPYRWLEDQDSAETRAWLEAENRCTEAALRSVPGRAQITNRLSELQKTDAYGTPLQRKDDYFFDKRAAGQDLYVICRRHGRHGADEGLLDPQGMSADHSTSVVLSGVSADAATVAYGVRAGGKDEVTMHFLDVKSRKDLSDVLPLADYFSLDFEPNGRGVYYARTTDSGPRVMHHVMGSDPSNDTEIFGKG